MTCPFLDYRDADAEHEFDHDRAYCTLAQKFVSPMKADICNDRHQFSHAEYCEIYQRLGPEEREEAPVIEPLD